VVAKEGWLGLKPPAGQPEDSGQVSFQWRQWVSPSLLDEGRFKDKGAVRTQLDDDLPGVVFILKDGSSLSVVFPIPEKGIGAALAEPDTPGIAMAPAKLCQGSFPVGRG